LRERERERKRERERCRTRVRKKLVKMWEIIGWKTFQGKMSEMVKRNATLKNVFSDLRSFP
jgi:hypothetical protein